MLLYGADKDVCAWVSNQLFGTDIYFQKGAAAIGVVIDKKLVCGVVYDDLHVRPDGEPYSIQMSVASIDKRWATRHNLRAFFKYPFTQLRLGRVQTHCSSTDEGVIMFNQRLGFVEEGVHRGAWPAGGDAVSWSMLKEECGWL